MGEALRTGGQRRFVAILGVVLVLLLGAEGAVRMRVGPLPEPQLWAGPETPLKEQQIDSLRENGGASVVFLGTSHMDAAADASAIPLPPGTRPAYNASTGAGSLGMIDVWARHVVVPRLEPDVVVLGLLSRELNPNDPRQQELERAFLASPAVRRLLGNETFMQRLTRYASDVSALVRYRTELREIDGLRTALGLGGPRVGRTYGDIVADDGQYEGFLENEYAVPEGVATALRTNALNEFTVGESKLATLRGLLRFLDRHVEHVVVVNMPVTQYYVDLHPEGAETYADVVATMQREAEGAGAVFVDAGVWPSEEFSDPGHTNGRGSRRFTALVAEVVTPLLSR